MATTVPTEWSFPDWKPKVFNGIPFVLTDPQGKTKPKHRVAKWAQWFAPAADAEVGVATLWLGHVSPFTS